MKASQILSTAGLAAVALAQTPPGFTPSVETKLEVTFGSKRVSEPGEAFTKPGERHNSEQGPAQRQRGKESFLTNA